MMARRFMIGAAFIAVILLDIWQHVHIVTMGYEVEQAQRKQKELQQIHQQLLVEVETLSENAPMRHLVQKEGFELESIRKNRVKKGESYSDEAVYFMLL